MFLEKIKAQRGFTLIELLVVIAIIGMLSSVVLASLNSARQKSRHARRLSDLRQIQVALEMYYDDNRKYPAGTNVDIETGLKTQLVTNGNYLPQIPKDPLYGTGTDNYHYTASSTNAQTYSLIMRIEKATWCKMSTAIDSQYASYNFCTGQSGAGQ